MPDFNALLSKRVEDAKRPKPLPTGTYMLQVGEHRFDESSKKKTPFVEFQFKILDAKEDVDRKQLAEVDTSRPVVHEFYLTDKADFMLADFLKAIGLEVGGGRTFGDCIPEASGRVVMASVRHEPIEGSDDFRARISRFTEAKE